MADPQQQMTAQDFAQSVRAKYPGSYDHLSDADLTSKVVAKYPQYKSVIPNAGLADPAAPGPVEKVSPTEGPAARFLTAGENRIADIHDQGVAQQKNEQHNFMTNGPIPSPIHLQNPVNAIVNPEARQRFSEGDVAGGLGETGANLAVMEVGRRMSGGESLGSKMTPENLAAPVRGVVGAINKALPHAGGVAGSIAGGALGHPWLGYGVGRDIGNSVTVPGERLGLPEQNVSEMEFGKNKGRLQGFGGAGATPTIASPTSTPPRGIIRPVGEPIGTPLRIPPTPRSTPVDTLQPRASVSTPEPIAEKPSQVSMADQIATARGMGFKNLGDAINKFGFEGWQKVLGQQSAEPPSVRPGSLTPFHSDAPLTPADLMNSRMNTRIPTWEEVERQGQKERFYAQAPQVKTKTQLVNEVEPSIVAKSEANTSPYDRNLPTKKIRK